MSEGGSRARSRARPSRLRLLHASDLHVGESFARAGESGMARLVGAANRLGVDLVLIAGDLFDSNRVKPPVVDAARAELQRLMAPAVILPGNHDPLETDSVYWRLQLPPGIRLLCDAAGERIDFPELDVSVWGRPHVSYSGDLQPLADMPAPVGSAWELAVGHGHWVDRPSYRAYQITPAEIAASRRDYVALGHWDVHMDVSVDGVRAAYSGSPSRFGQSLLVSLERRNGTRSVTIEQLRFW